MSSRVDEGGGLFEFDSGGIGGIGGLFQADNGSRQ